MRKTALILPTDNRPVTYSFAQLLVQLANLNLLVPPRNLMGSLTAPSDLRALTQWINEAVAKVESGAILICLDSLLYGGLIPARRSDDSLETILARAANIVYLKKQAQGKIKIFAQSSIMRMSDNYDNTEEKLYWSKYGREIFYWSQLLHKKEIGILESETELCKVEASIPAEIRQDYLATRARNFAVNEKIIDYVVSGDLDFLIFSQDDSGRYGLNVLEKDKLIALARAKGAHNVLAYPGADEMLMTLIARYLNNERTKEPLVALHYSASGGDRISSNYEGQSIGESMHCQANGQGLKIVESDIKSGELDFHIIVHTGVDKQGDHMWLPGLPDLRSIESKDSAKRVVELIEQAQAPIVLCDLVYSNGADPNLIELLLERPHLFNKIWSYAGWNTTGNAVGSALAVGAACVYARSSVEGLNDLMRKKVLFMRLMDDWAYQTEVRKEISLDETLAQQQEKLSILMKGYAAKLANVLEFQPRAIEYKLPWNRTFEVEINLDSQVATALS